MRKVIFLALSILGFSNLLSAQSPFNIYLEPVSIAGLGGLQSYAFAQNDGKWLILGGRLDGLHRRQPWASFDLAGHNDQLVVVDPMTKEVWTSQMSSLPSNIQEQLRSTNMEFYQEGDFLYCVGGYGYSSSAGDHVTFDNLSAVDVPGVISAIIDEDDITPYFRQVTHENFQVTGGKLLKIDDVYHLVGGQKFMGRYNPMGPNHGPGFIQEYTNAIHKFTIDDDGTTLNISHLGSYINSEHLHRRDFNVVQQILPQGNEGLTAFSGVFQASADLPFLNCVNIDSIGYEVHPTFEQYYNHYHCATIPLYSDSLNEMHNLFFGGIAQFYDDNGTLIQDDDVPFVKTIARVTRTSNGEMVEYKLPVEMPALLGAGSEFLVQEDLPHFSNGVLKLDELQDDSTLLGHIFGGISSSQPNIFWINTGTESSAANSLFKVYLVQGETVGIHDLNARSNRSFDMKVYPVPADKIVHIEFHSPEAAEAELIVYNTKGEEVAKTILTNLAPAANEISYELPNQLHEGSYVLTIKSGSRTASQQIVIRR